MLRTAVRPYGNWAQVYADLPKYLVFFMFVASSKYMVQSTRFNQPGGKEIVPLWKRRGFTLIELIVVLVIIGIVAGVAIPRFTGSFDSIKFRKTMSDVVFFIRGSRNRAMSTGKIANVIFDLHGGFCWNDDKKILRLPEEVEMFTDNIDARDEQTRTFSFYPNGMASEEKLGFVCDNMVAVLHIEPLGGIAYYKLDEKMEQTIRYTRSGKSLSDEEIKKDIDKLKDSDKLTGVVSAEESVIDSHVGSEEADEEIKSLDQDAGED